MLFYRNEIAWADAQVLLFYCSGFAMIRAQKAQLARNVFSNRVALREVTYICQYLRQNAELVVCLQIVVMAHCNTIMSRQGKNFNNWRARRRGGLKIGLKSPGTLRCHIDNHMLLSSVVVGVLWLQKMRREGIPTRSVRGLLYIRTWIRRACMWLYRKCAHALCS